MKKYPVISKKGNTYEVSMFFGESIKYAGFNIHIYKRVPTFFGLLRRKKLVEYTMEYYNQYDLTQEYTYVEIAKWAVGKYESEIDNTDELRLRELRNRSDFEDWDGKC